MQGLVDPIEEFGFYCKDILKDQAVACHDPVYIFKYPSYCLSGECMEKGPREGKREIRMRHDDGVDRRIAAETGRNVCG